MDANNISYLGTPDHYGNETVIGVYKYKAGAKPVAGSFVELYEDGGVQYVRSVITAGAVPIGVASVDDCRGRYPADKDGTIAVCKAGSGIAALVDGTPPAIGTLAKILITPANKAGLVATAGTVDTDKVVSRVDSTLDNDGNVVTSVVYLSN